MWSRLLNRVVLILLCSLPAPALSQVLINEYLALNLADRVDEFGHHEDWIELHNPGPIQLELDGFGLSDDEDEPFKWILPPALIAPHGYLLIFASGRDRTYWINHWETIIFQGDRWKYRPGDSEPPSDWRAIDFDDSEWETGPSGFGYGDGDDATIIDPTIALYVRHTFWIAEPLTIRELVLHVDFDDGFVAYINDVEVARSNLGVPGDHPAHDQTAYQEHEAVMYQGNEPLPFAVRTSPPSAYLRPGANVVAIQVHNVSPDSDDLTLIPFLTLGMDQPPPDPVGFPEYLTIHHAWLHTNFRIAADGEVLTLSDAAGAIQDQISTGPMLTDISRGRQPDAGPVWLLFAEPTPEASNTTSGSAVQATAPTFAPAAGHHPGSITVALSSPEPSAMIRFTLDGGEPSTASALYTDPIPVLETTVIRARAHEPDRIPSPIITRSFLIDEDVDLPVMSVATAPPNLWDDQIGIYVMGPNAQPDPPYHGANFWQDWERPAHIEYLPADGGSGFDEAVGIKIHGGNSRMYAQKSLRLLARRVYGESTIQFPLFRARSITEFKRILLRNAGNDWWFARFRDAFWHRVAAATDLDRQAHEPTVVFLNGEYWGIHNIRERFDRFYLESHHGVDPDAIDMLEDDGLIMEGDANHYHAMLSYIEQHDLADDFHYGVVKTMMEVDNFAEYYVMQLYASNWDWPHNNVKYWRPATPGGRWRWFLFDVDGGIWDYYHNSLAVAMRPFMHNFLFRNLLRNDGFRHSFINRYADRLNSTFLPENLHPILDVVRGSIEPEMPRHVERWGFPLDDWYEDVQNVVDFVDHRPSHARAHIMEEFELSHSLDLSLDVLPPGGGHLALTAIEVDSAWTGTYFAGVPVPLTAVPADGYFFTGWSDTTLPDVRSVLLDLGDDYAVTALFEQGTARAIINEINYHAAAQFDPEDWVEFHNAGNVALNLTGWQFRDAEDNHIFHFPAGTFIGPGGFLVLCRSTQAFSALFPEVPDYLGDMDFGLSGDGELVRLYDASVELVNYVEYDDEPPWPPEPDGHGPTLELTDPELNNALPSSWAASLAAHGTPGAPNSVPPGTGVPVTGDMPLELRLYRPSPNPFNPSTRLDFDLPTAVDVRLAIYDAGGRLVRVLAGGALAAGRHHLLWDGRNGDGKPVVSGVYFCQLRAGQGVFRRKLLLVR